MTRRLALLGALALAAGCGEPEIIVPEMLTIVALLPAHGSAGIAVDVQPLVYFSHAAASTAEVESGFSLACLGAPVSDACNEPDAAACAAALVTAEVSYDDAHWVARLAPAAGLQSDTCYALTVGAGIAAFDANVGPLPVDVTSVFRTQ